MHLLEDQCCNFVFFSRLSDQVTMSNPGVLAVHAFQVPFGLPEPMNLSEDSVPLLGVRQLLVLSGHYLPNKTD